MYNARMTTISERILEAMKDAGFPSQTALSRASGVPQPTINRIINRVGTPETQNLKKIADACDVSVQWLLDGTGPKSRAERNELAHSVGTATRRVVVPDPTDVNFAKIRKVTLRLSAGILGFKTEEGDDDGETISMDLRWLEKRGLRQENLIAIDVKGQSMEPMLFDGDTVVINTADKKAVDGAVFAVNYEGEAVVKRMARDAGDWWLSSDNADQRRFPRKVCRGQECIIVGRVVQKLSEQI
jgi:phage repressor protein C with HTH and peptisase S24 domain